MNPFDTAYRLSLLLLTAGAAAACSSSTSDPAASGGDEDLTSLTARARTLNLGGTVYVRADASDAEIMRAVKHQTQSGLGAFRTANIGVNTRELHTIDASKFVKSTVTVVDASRANDPGTPMLKVQYTYSDNAVVPASARARSAISLALLNGGYESQTERILTECTDNDSHAREFQSSLWYVFNPSLSRCKTAMATEQRAIDADRSKLGPSKVPLSEVNRLYLPITASLKSAATATKATYPDYDRLYGGGVEPGKLVIGMVNGLMADWAAGEHHDTIDDEGYSMWFEGLREIFKARPELKLVGTEPQEDFSQLVAGGKTYTGLSFDDVMKWELDGTGFPDGADTRALRVAASDKVLRHWFFFEAPMTVTIGTDAPKQVTVRLQTYFGAETWSAPHRRAIKTSDVFVYNGHSYIGYGPLDPSNFRSTDFPQSYQILFVNGCVSYNYYEKDYFALKTNGSKDLDLVSNGLESWVQGSGPAVGRFVGAIIDGKQQSYQGILRAAQFTDFGYSWGMDALRVVDGELDNTYDPAKTPITVRPQL